MVFYSLLTHLIMNNQYNIVIYYSKFYIKEYYNKLKNIFLFIYIFYYYNNLFYLFILSYYFINQTYIYNSNKLECPICYSIQYHIKYNNCNKPQEHFVCKDCYENKYYNRNLCHLCQIPIY